MARNDPKDAKAAAALDAAAKAEAERKAEQLAELHLAPAAAETCEQAEIERAGAQLADLKQEELATVHEPQAEPAAETLKHEAARDRDQPLPESVTLAAPYAYYDDAGLFHTWGEGVEVSDADEVRDLIQRAAPLR